MKKIEPPIETAISSSYRDLDRSEAFGRSGRVEWKNYRSGRVMKFSTGSISAHDPSDPLHTWPVTQRSRLIKKCKGNYFRVNSVQSKSFLVPLWFTRKGGKQQIGKKRREMHCIFMQTYIHTYIIISIRSWSMGMGHWIKRSWPMTHGPLCCVRDNKNTFSYRCVCLKLVYRIHFMYKLNFR